MDGSNWEQKLIFKLAKSCYANGDWRCEMPRYARNLKLPSAGAGSGMGRLEQSGDSLSPVYRDLKVRKEVRPQAGVVKRDPMFRKPTTIGGTRG